MSDFFRALCAELVDDLQEWVEGYLINDSADEHTAASLERIDRVRAALAEPDHIPDARKMAEPVEGEVAELVDLLLSEADCVEIIGNCATFTATKLRRAADLLSRLAPQPVLEGPSDEELLELMPQQFRDDLATVSRLASYGTPVEPGIYRVSLNTGALDFARAVLARWGRP